MNYLKFRVSTTAFAAIFFLLFQVVTGADLAPDQSGSPYFVISGERPEIDGLPLKHTGADVTITGVVANVKVNQVYVNTGKNPIEAIYVFPASTRAAVHSMQMHIGKRIVTAKIQEKEKARQQYNEAVAAGKTASLLEQHRPNVFQMNVGNIMPGDTIKVELTYTELLIPTDGKYEFVYPTVVGPRYSGDPQSTAKHEQWLDTKYTPENELPQYTFDLQIDIHSGIKIKEVNCKSHQVNINTIKATHHKVSLAASEAHAGNKDFILEYALKGEQIESGVMLFEGEEENFFMLMTQPPKKVRPEEIPPREYIFIIDVSGSMYGYPLDVTKALMSRLFKGLKAQDRFNIMFFSGGNFVLAPQSLPATEDNIEKALSAINQQRGGGGTNLLPALQRALAMKGTESHARSFVIATDGYVSVEKQAFDLIRDNLNKANFFSFGIGKGVNRYIIEGMAKIGHGEPFIATDQSSAEEMGKKFEKYINAPVLTNIQLNIQGLDAYDVEPKNFPDVFAQRPVVVYGKYKGEAKGSIKITGTSGKGTYEYEQTLDKNGESDKFSALKYIWARNKLALLSDYGRINHSPEYKQQIVDLGLKYNLLSEHTSFVAIDDQIRNVDGKPTRVEQPLPLPEGVSNHATANLTTASGAGGVMTRVQPILGNASYFKSHNTPKESNHTVQSVKVLPESAKNDVYELADVVTLSLDAVAIEEDVDELEEQLLTPPSYIGGKAAIKKLIDANLQYPKVALEAGIEEKIVLDLIIDHMGMITKITVIRGQHASLIKEAKRLAQLLKNWQPATQNGQATEGKHRLKVNFKLPE